MNAGWLRKKIDLKEKQILNARLRLARLQAEQQVYQETLNAEPTMEFEYEPIEC